jgi:16S rRNA (cytosine967-C5)-methyltransferase
LYGTCSVFAQENESQIKTFVEQTPDAECVNRVHFLPDERHDGFFYALLSKRVV